MGAARHKEQRAAVVNIPKRVPGDPENYMHEFETQNTWNMSTTAVTRMVGVGERYHLVMGDTSLPSDCKFPTTLPQLSFLVHFRLIHILSSDLEINEIIRLDHDVGTRQKLTF